MNDSSERTIALIFGYIPQIDRSSKAAADRGLEKRFAIALDTYRSSSDGMYFDHKLLHTVLEAILPLLSYDKLNVSFSSKTMTTATPAEIYTATIDGPEPFTAMELISGQKPICYIHAEFYNEIGGPFPYHDTYTFSFYCATYDQEEVKATLIALQDKEDFLIRDIIYGGDQPDISLVTRLKGML